MEFKQLHFGSRLHRGFFADFIVTLTFVFKEISFLSGFDFFANYNIVKNVDKVVSKMYPKWYPLSILLYKFSL